MVLQCLVFTLKEAKILPFCHIGLVGILLGQLEFKYARASLSSFC